MRVVHGSAIVFLGRSAHWKTVGQLIALLLAIGALSCTEKANPPNLLLLSIDTLRANHLGSYGPYYSERSPANSMNRPWST